MILSLMLACGSSTYDVYDWESPLASDAAEPGDAARGETIYFEEHWTDSSTYGFTCDSCHGSSSADTLLVDDGALNRPAHTTWNAPWRGTWKGSQRWDAEESGVLGAYGGQICIKAYFPDGSAMDAQQAADLEAWMRENMDEAPADDDPRASPLDFGFNSWDTKDDVVASLMDGTDWLRGEDIGDPTNGEALALTYCGACHDDGSGAVVLFTADTQSTGQLLARVRKIELDGIPVPNTRMPRLAEDKLVDEDLLDILAWLTRNPL